jgi:bifunctional non-homologous end joining protein LigD
MLAQEVAEPFDNDNWIYEIKWDGYRAIAEIIDGEVRLYSRNSKMFNSAYPIIVDELKKIKSNLVLDGEVVAINEQGKPDFQQLQDYMKNSDVNLCFYVFDLLYINGSNICEEPLIERKRLLRQALPSSDIIKYADHVIGEGKAFFEVVKDADLEGMMAKKMDTSYYPGKRVSTWLKIKHHKSIDAYIAGYTAPKGERQYFGSLVLAIKEENKLRYIGNVGTGFNFKKLETIHKLLSNNVIQKSPFDRKIQGLNNVTWVNPKVICEVTYSEMTKDGILRHPVFVEIKKE